MELICAVADPLSEPWLRYSVLRRALENIPNA
jgi:hypothetical protein